MSVCPPSPYLSRSPLLSSPLPPVTVGGHIQSGTDVNRQQRLNKRGPLLLGSFALKLGSFPPS